MTETTAVVLEHIGKRHGRTVVLADVTATIHPGAVTALLGTNGAGKTTLLHIVAGLTEPTSGAVRVVTSSGGVVACRDAIGFCPDDLAMPDLLTGSEYLDLVTGVRGLRVPTDIRRALLAGVRLDRAEHLLVGAYSHGMRRKLQLVAALLHGPRVLVLDEPMRGLDPESSALLRTLLRRWADRGNVVFLATHDLLAAERTCDRALVLDGGTIRGDLRPGAILGASEPRGRQSDATGGASDLESRFLALTGSDGDASPVFLDALDALDAFHRDRG